MTTKIVNIPEAEEEKLHSPLVLSPVPSGPASTTAFPLSIRIFKSPSIADALSYSKMQGSSAQGIHFSPHPTAIKDGEWTTVNFAVCLPSATLKAGILEASPSQSCCRLKIRFAIFDLIILPEPVKIGWIRLFDQGY
jgi:hypothetical protein